MLPSVDRAPIGAAASASGQWQRARHSDGVAIGTYARVARVAAVAYHHLNRTVVVVIVERNCRRIAAHTTIVYLYEQSVNRIVMFSVRF